LGEEAVRRLTAVAAVAGLIAAVVAADLVPVKPIERRDWLPTVAVAAALAGLFARPWPVRAALGAIVAVITAWVVAPTWEDAEPWRGRAFAAVAAGVFAAWLVEPLSRRPGRTWPWLLALTAAAAAVVLERSGNARFALLAGVLTALIAGIGLAGRGRAVADGLLPVAAVLLPGLLALGYENTFSDVPLACFVLVAVAPLLLAVASLLPRGRLAGQVLAVAVPVAAAVFLAVRAESIDLSGM
jgi:hypothetical protein